MYKANHAPWILNKHLFIGVPRVRQEVPPQCVKMSNNKTHAGSKCAGEGRKTDAKALTMKSRQNVKPRQNVSGSPKVTDKGVLT